jgi:membrane peptidoglycan carboxypeptidase
VTLCDSEHYGERAKMKPLHEQKPRLTLPRPRAALIRIHTDLLRVHSHANPALALSPSELTNLEKLCLALEDRRFYRHHGVDIPSVLRELLRATTFRRHGGASTIDMQFVRTVTGYKDWTLRRKLYEMVLAMIIQFRYSKIVILRSYLTCAYFGWRLKGSTAAANKVFKKNADDLSLDEAAFIAAMLVYPQPRNPAPEWVLRVERRAQYGKRIYIANKQRFDQFPG